MAVMQVTQTTYTPFCLVADSTEAISNRFTKSQFKYATLGIWLELHILSCRTTPKSGYEGNKVRYQG